MKNIKKEDYPLLYGEALSLYEKSRGDNLKPFPMSERKKYYKSGNRNDFEKLYFNRRDYLSATAILCLFDGKYIPELEKIILAVCDEYCWALPAHVPGISFVDKRIIDLFVAETGFVLSEICSVFSDALSKALTKRIKVEIKKRLFNNFVSHRYFWEKKEMNWASVCGGFVGGTLIYLFPDVFERNKKRILKTLGCYVKGFTDDGFCLEGPLYWQYGFFAYSVFADLLYRHSDGEDDLFTDEKVKNIAAYGGRCLLTGNTSVSFSDADEKFMPDYALQQLLQSKGMAESVPENRLCFYNANTKWMNLYRAVIWKGDREGGVQGGRKKTVYSPSANQLIVSTDTYSFAMKGGHNDEPHNHNDLGSFIYSDKDGQVFCDLGSGRYTKDYFNNKKRYGIFCNSSLSHNVPIIDGSGQKAGKAFSAVLSFEKGVAVCDISSAYKELGKGSIIRRVEIMESGIILTDSFRLGGKTVTERLVSLRKADTKEGVLDFGGTKLTYPAEKVTLSVKEEKHTPHEYDAEDITVYCYDFLLRKGVTEISFEIEGTMD